MTEPDSGDKFKLVKTGEILTVQSVEFDPHIHADGFAGIVVYFEESSSETLRPYGDALLWPEEFESEFIVKG